MRMPNSVCLAMTATSNSLCSKRFASGATIPSLVLTDRACNEKLESSTKWSNAISICSMWPLRIWRSGMRRWRMIMRSLLSSVMLAAQISETILLQDSFKTIRNSMRAQGTARQSWQRAQGRRRRTEKKRRQYLWCLDRPSASPPPIVPPKRAQQANLTTLRLTMPKKLRNIFREWRNPRSTASMRGHSWG